MPYVFFVKPERKTTNIRDIFRVIDDSNLSDIGFFNPVLCCEFYSLDNESEIADITLCYNKLGGDVVIYSSKNKKYYFEKDLTSDEHDLVYGFIHKCQNEGIL